MTRLDVAELWVRSIRRIWTREFILDSLKKCGVVPFTRLRHLEGNAHLVSIADCILRAEEMSRKEEAYKERQVNPSLPFEHVEHTAHVYVCMCMYVCACMCVRMHAACICMCMYVLCWYVGTTYTKRHT